MTQILFHGDTLLKCLLNCDDEVINFFKYYIIVTRKDKTKGWPEAATIMALYMKYMK